MKKRRIHRTYTAHNPRDRKEIKIKPFVNNVDSSMFEVEADDIGQSIYKRRSRRIKVYSPLPEMDNLMPVVLYCIHSSNCLKTAFIHNGVPKWGYDPEKINMIKKGSPCRQGYCNHHNPVNN